MVLNTGSLDLGSSALINRSLSKGSHKTRHNKVVTSSHDPLNHVELVNDPLIYDIIEGDGKYLFEIEGKQYMRG